MKKILVVGANGKIGRILTRKLKDSRDFEPVALVRKAEQGRQFDDLGVKSIVESLENSVEALSGHLGYIDVVVFTAGSGGHTGYDMTLAIDLDGAGKMVEASKLSGVKRFVMVSALGAGDRSVWKNEKMRPYYIAKHYADEFLILSGLDYTILRPGTLLDEKGTGKIALEVAGKEAKIPREDVADVILTVIQNDGAIGKSIDLVSGDTPIPDAIGQIG